MAPLTNIRSGASPNADLDRLKAMKADTPEAEKARLRKVTQEFEAFFTYYMLKTMRETIPKDESGESPMGSDLGKDMFTDMFDMQIGRNMSQGKSRSLSDMLYKSLEKLIDAKTDPTAISPARIPIPLKPAAKKAVPVQPEPINLPATPAKELGVTRPKAIDLPEAPRRVTHDKVISLYGDLIDEAAQTHNVDSALIASVIRAESSGNANAVSGAGAKGLMQLTDSTAQYLGVEDSLDPKENIMGGAKYLRQLMDKYGDIRLALAAYNAGPGNVDKYGGVPPFKETTAYVAKVTELLKSFGATIDQPAKDK
jgi:Rod binding domain-containing protein